MFTDRSDSIRPDTAVESPHQNTILVGEAPVRGDFHAYMMKSTDEENLSELVKDGLQAIIPSVMDLFNRTGSPADSLEKTDYRTAPPPRSKHISARISRQNRKGSIPLTKEE